MAELNQPGASFDRRLGYASGATSRGRASGVRLGSMPANSQEDVRFVQDRIALFAKTTFLISAMFLVATSVSDLLYQGKGFPLPARASHAVGTLLALSVWLTGRRGKLLSPNALQMLDVGFTLGVCWAFTLMGSWAPAPYGYYTAMLAVSHVSTSRSIIVPSVPQRTLFLAIASFGALVLARWQTPLASELIARGGPRGKVMLDVVLWSTAGCAVATIASKVIYGLREIAREARQLGQYLLEEKIGAGGMGEVYRARHAMLRRPTAVKLLVGDATEAQLVRFEREVQLTARLTHPNTISVYDYGRTPEGTFYYAMELLEGMTLEELVREHGPLPPSRIIHLLRQVCGALQEAHGSGLIHRDVKPANIYLCRRGDIPDFVKVLDFGLVRELTSSEASKSLSRVDAVIGTPHYLSPEAILTPHQIDARADIYGLGCVAYFLATGSPPFGGQTLVEVCAHHLHTEPVPPREHVSIPADLETTILSCLVKDPKLRPQRAADLAEKLGQCADAEGWKLADAETWWRQVGDAKVVPSKKARPKDEPQRTICCDFERRLKSANE